MRLCILFAVNAFILEVISTSHNLAIAMICAPMMIHMVGHNLLIPMTLSYALKDYAKVTGTAGSIFGAIYYVVIAAVTYLVSKIHGATISNFALLCFVLSISSAISFWRCCMVRRKRSISFLRKQESKVKRDKSSV